MAQKPKLPKLHLHPPKRANLLPGVQNWKHNIDHSFITATPSEFKIRFTKEWVERSAKVPHEFLSDPVEGSVEDFRSRLSEASLPDSADQDNDPGTRAYRHQPKHSKNERKSPKLTTQGLTTKGKKHVEKLIKSSKDSKSPTPDIPRSIYSSAKSKSQPPTSTVLPYLSTDEPRKSPAVLFSQSEEEHRNSPLHFDVRSHSKRISESPTTAPTFIASTSGRSSKKVAPIQQTPSNKKKLSSSSDSFSVDEPLKPLPPTAAEDANTKDKEEEATEVAKGHEVKTPEPEQRPLSQKGHADSPSLQDPVPHSKANKKGHLASPTRQHIKTKKHRPTRLGNHRLGKIRRRKVGVAFSPRGSTLPDDHDDGRSESTNQPPTPRPKEPSNPPVDQQELKITPPNKPENPEVSDDTTNDDDVNVQCRSAGVGSVDVDKVDEKESDSSSQSAIIPLRYLKPKATTDGVREIFFHDNSPAQSDSSDTSEDQVAAVKPKTPRKDYEKKDGDGTERKSKSLGHNNETHVEGNEKKQQNDEMVHQDGDRANVRAKRHPNTPYTSVRNLDDDAMNPELAIFVQRAKPSLGRNGRLNWKNKRQPTVLYFESKIMPKRDKIQTKFIPLLPYEEKLKRLYEDNPYDEELMLALTKQMAGKGLESDQVSLVRNVASDASLPSQLDEDDGKTDIKSSSSHDDDDDDQVGAEDKESLLHPIPPMNTPGGPSMPMVGRNYNNKNLRNKSNLG